MQVSWYIRIPVLNLLLTLIETAPTGMWTGCQAAGAPVQACQCNCVTPVRSAMSVLYSSCRTAAACAAAAAANSCACCCCAAAACAAAACCCRRRARLAAAAAAAVVGAVGRPLSNRGTCSCASGRFSLGSAGITSMSFTTSVSNSDLRVVKGCWSGRVVSQAVVTCQYSCAVICVVFGVVLFC
jgi:hypothetical protein